MEDSMSIVSLVAHAGIVVKLILLLLLCFSLVSWMVIFQRAVSLKRADVAFREFETTFWSGIDVRQLEHSLGDRHEGIAAVFQAGMNSFKRLRGGLTRQTATVTPKQASAVLVDVERSMRVAVAEEEGRLNRYLPVLATISSASPYIGLFGTVWGIMGSFLTLSAATRADLSTVAPWVAEALVATAMGLFAAIPAVIAYNRFTATTERLVLGYRDFAEELHTLLYRSLLSPASSAAKQGQ